MNLYQPDIRRIRIPKKRKPCQSHITLLNKVRSKLDWRLTMGFSTLMLSKTNEKKIDRASEHILKAIKILETIE